MVVIKKTVLLSRFFDEPNNLLLILPVPLYLNRSRINLIVILFTLGFLGAGSLIAQQPTLITHNMFTNMAINPAYAGNSGGIAVTGLVRQQWIGWKNSDGSHTAPQTFLLTVDSPIKLLHGGIGGSISDDQIAYFKNIVLKLGYAYKTEMGSGDLSIGLNGNLQNISNDASKYDPVTKEDPLLTSQEGKSNDMIADLGIGAYFKVPEKYYVGFSADNLLQTVGKKTHYKLRRTYYLTGGYQWIIPDHPAFELLPSVLLEYDGAAFQFNASALLMYENKIYGGLGYRLQDAVSVLVGVLYKGLRIGVAYDISTSAMHKYNSGGLEVMVNYIFKIDTDKFRKSYRNTRFL